MPSFDVVWTYENGIVAALVGYKEMRAVDLDVAANAVMADDAKNCTGDFASGRKISEPAKFGKREAAVHLLPLGTASRSRSTTPWSRPRAGI